MAAEIYIVIVIVDAILKLDILTASTQKRSTGSKNVNLFSKNVLHMPDLNTNSAKGGNLTYHFFKMTSCDTWKVKGKTKLDKQESTVNSYIIVPDIMSRIGLAAPPQTPASDIKHLTNLSFHAWLM